MLWYTEKNETVYRGATQVKLRSKDCAQLRKAIEQLGTSPADSLAWRQSRRYFSKPNPCQYQKLYWRELSTRTVSSPLVRAHYASSNPLRDRTWSAIWARIYKPLRSPGTDYKEQIPQAYAAWRAGTITRAGIFKQSMGARNRVGIVIVPARQAT